MVSPIKRQDLGTEIRNEAEALQGLIEAFKTGENYARMLAHMRRDTRWLKVAAMLFENQKRVINLATRKVGHT